MIIALFFGAVYSLLGVALLMAGFLVFDALTPGRLGRHLTQDGGSLSSGVIIGALFLGLGAIVATAIWSNADAGFGPALGWTLAFGALGIALQSLSVVVLDLLTPGDLRRIVVEPGLHPAAVVTAASQLAVSAVICVAIS